MQTDMIFHFKQLLYQMYGCKIDEIIVFYLLSERKYFIYSHNSSTFASKLLFCLQFPAFFKIRKVKWAHDTSRKMIKSLQLTIYSNGNFYSDRGFSAISDDTTKISHLQAA